MLLGHSLEPCQTMSYKKSHMLLRGGLMRPLNRSIDMKSSFFDYAIGSYLFPLELGTGITRDGEPIDDAITQAINHPIGHVTQALCLNLWFKREPNVTTMSFLPTLVHSLHSCATFQ